MPSITPGSNPILRVASSRAGFAFLCAAVIACFLMAAPRAFPQSPPKVRADERFVEDLVQDNTGRVWARPSPSVPGNLFYWDQSSDPPGWRIDDTLDASSLYLRSLVSGNDGRVYGLWHDTTSNSWSLSRHSGEQSAMIAAFGPEFRFSGPNDGIAPVMLVDSTGIVWLGPLVDGILRVKIADAAVSTKLTPLTAAHVRDPRGEQLNIRNTALSAFEDPRGRIWFWGPTSRARRQSLRGAFVFDKGEVIEYPTFQGLPDEPWSAVEVKDDITLWIALVDAGTYELNLDSMTATPINEPEPGALRFVYRINRVRDAWWFDSVVEPAPDQARSIAVWRLQGTTWSRVPGPARLGRKQRPVLPIDQGVLVGGNAGEGIWFVPDDGGDPISIDWRRGIPMPAAHSLHRLVNGNILANERFAGTVSIDFATLLDASPEPLSIESFRLASWLVQTPDARLWGVLPEPQSLGEWNGDEWRTHPVPDDARTNSRANPRADSLGRVWLIVDNPLECAAIYDPAADSWAVFPTYNDALADHAVRRAPFEFLDVLVPQVRFSNDGRICYTTGGEQMPWLPLSLGMIAYFDGTSWNHYKIEDIGPPGRVPGARADGPCFFNSAGQPAINIGGQTWALVDATWQPVESEPGPWKMSDISGSFFEVTKRSQLEQVDEMVVRDTTGTRWLVRERELLKSRDGITIPALPRPDLSPFADGSELLKAFIDPRGNTVLCSDGRDCVIVPREPVPDTILTFDQRSLDEFRINMSTPSPGNPLYSWRIDAGEWSAPSEISSVDLEPLPEGDHIVQAKAMNRDIEFDPTPAEITITVRGIDEEILRWIEALGDPDYAVREDAVTRLARFPEQARPALEVARNTATDDVRWWIDATLQRIDRLSAGAPPPATQESTAP